MSENLKYNLKDELLSANDRLQGSLSLMGMTMLTQPAYNNSMRSVMFTSHLKQFVDLMEPDFPGFFTNGENTVGKYSSGYRKVKNKTSVYRKIVKYEDILENPTVYVLFVYDEKKERFDVWERKDSENLTEVFGYNYDNEVIDSYEEGDTIEKDTVVYKSESYDEYMNYGYGKNVPLLYTLDPYTSEDACVIAQSLCDEMKSIEINKVSIGVNDNDFLLNLYGDDTEYKPIPDIGEMSNGEVAVKRTLFTNQLLVDFKDKALHQIFDSDTCFYKSGKVIDIDIYCNNPDLPDNPFNAQIIKYIKSEKKYYKEIKRTCEDIMKSGRKYTHSVDYLYKRACEFLDENKKWKGETVFSNLLIDITVKNTIPLQIGQKLTGRYGNKSVISEIRNDDDMPFYYDDNGNKVTIKLLFNVLAIINRTTAFPMYELTINYICNKVRAHMKNMSTLKEKETLLFGLIKDFNEKQEKEMKKKYSSLTKKEKEEYIESCINDRIFIHQSPMWETKPIFFRLLDIYKKYDFLTPYDIYINKWGRTIKCLNNAFVGEMYILKLKQTSRKGFSARGTGAINAKGLPERSYKNKSFTERISSTPIRFGEFESLNFAIAMLPEDINMFHMLYRTSAKGRRELAEYIINPDGKDEFKISKTYTNIVAEIFAVILKSLGLRLDFIDETKELLEAYSDDNINDHELNGVHYLCSDFQFLLLKRYNDIEKEILDKYGAMEKEALKEAVITEYMSRNYIITVDEDELKNQYGFRSTDEIE